MATKLYIPEQETFEIGGRKFTVTAWPTMFGLSVQERLMSGLTPELMKEMIVKSVSVDSIAIDDKKFDQVFSRKYKELMELVQKVMQFNFGEVDDAEDVSSEGTASPKDESDTSE